MKFILPKSNLVTSFDDISLYSTLSNTQINIKKYFSNSSSLYALNFLQDMWNGEKVNFTEKRPSLHFSSRFFENENFSNKFLKPSISKEIKYVLTLSEQIRNGKFGTISDIIHIGTGGSNLGPKLIYNAFQDFKSGPNMHFISNIDPYSLTYTVKNLNPKTTLIFVVSKSFNTLETLVNLKRVKVWLNSQLNTYNVNSKIFAITSIYNNAIKNNILPSNIITFDKSIGGRFSIWSAANISTPVAFGKRFFLNFLKGGNKIDLQIIKNRETSLSFHLAFRNEYTRNFKKQESHCIIPYSDRLKLLPSYLQQLIMESNGKTLNKDLVNINTPSSNIFGCVGTDAQHSFFQSLHQSSIKTSIDLICFEEIHPKNYHLDEELDNQAFDLLRYNAFSQFLAFKNGTSKNIKSNNHKFVRGDKSVNLLLFNKMNEENLGKLICLYEYKTIIEASLSKINPFDQFGVELGKNLLKKNNRST